MNELLTIILSIPIYLNGEYRSMIQTAYGIITRAVLAVSAVAVGALGIRMLFSDSGAAEKAKKDLLRILMAAAAILLLPSVISMAIQVFSGLGWEPGRLRQGG